MEEEKQKAMDVVLHRLCLFVSLEQAPSLCKAL